MPVWLQAAGAIALALFSYLTGYDDTKVRDMLKDIAYDLKQALQRLSLISNQIDVLIAEVRKLPDELRHILKEQELAEHNTAIQASIVRLKTLIATKRDDNFTRRQLEDIFNDLVETTTKLQVLSQQGTVELAPVAALLVPVAMLLELAILFRLGRSAKRLREQTLERYRDWIGALLADGTANNVKAAVADAHARLTAAEKEIRSGLLAALVTNPGTMQPAYALEHRIGSTDKVPRMLGGDGVKTWAEYYSETWISCYAVTQLDLSPPENGVQYWSASTPLERRDFARVASSDHWYGQGAPPWSVPVETYDSRDLQRFRGQNHPARVADIVNSPMWQSFLHERWPTALQSLQHLNELRLYAKMADDVFASLDAASHITTAAANSVIDMEAVDAVAMMEAPLSVRVPA